MLPTAPRRTPSGYAAFVLIVLASGAACGTPRAGADGEPAASSRQGGPVRPGISVLLSDSIHLIRGKRIGLLTNHTGMDESSRSDIELLRTDPRATAAQVSLVQLFSPEHGIRGTEDRERIASGIDERSGLPIHSLYGSGTLAMPDSIVRRLDAVVFDLQDIGTRTWTYVGNLVYALRGAQRTGVFTGSCPLPASRPSG